MVFNNISAISWWSVLLLEETGVPGENHRLAASHWQTLVHNVVSSTPHLSGVGFITLVVMGTDCIGSNKSNYHTITTMTAHETKLVHLYIIPYHSIILCSITLSTDENIILFTNVQSFLLQSRRFVRKFWWRYG
jgi:hypothetical protein